MNCKKVDSRTLLISDLPDIAEDGTRIFAHDLEISIRYTEGGPYTAGIKGTALDSVIIPAIIKALNGTEE